MQRTHRGLPWRGRQLEGRPDCSDLRQAHGSELTCITTLLLLAMQCAPAGARQAWAGISSMPPESIKVGACVQSVSVSPHQRVGHLASSPW